MSNEITVFRSQDSRAQFERAYKAALGLWPVPYEELYASTAFGLTHVLACGPKGKPSVVLLHPAGCGAVIWARNAFALSREFRVYAVDTIGEVNLSRPSKRVATVQGFTDWLAELLDGLKVGRAHFVGNSFGGFLALCAGIYLPDRVNRLVLISPAGSFTQMWPWILHFFPAYMSRSTRVLKWAFDWIWQDFPVDACIQELRMITSVSGVPRHVGPKVFSDQELRKVKAPTLLLIGDHEVIYNTKRVVQRAKRFVQNLRYEEIEQANHNAEYTSAEQVNRKVTGFLCGKKLSSA
jgi:pimeloyl-ACP methyl ester carboxylesterase